MSRFEDFEKLERRVIREALTGAQSEFYDPGHTQEDRATLEALIREIEGDDLPFTFGEEPDRPVIPITVPTPVEPQRIDIALTYGKKKAQEPPRDARQGGPERPGVHTHTWPPKRPSRPAGAATEPKGETGFLLIRCAHCGDVHAFCARQPITTYRCNECGGRTPLTDMFPLRVMCECGGKYSYRTNITEKQMDVNCYKCGCPVAVEWSERRGRYEPIGWGEGKKRKGRRK